MSIRADKKLRILFEPVRGSGQVDNDVFALNRIRILEVGGYHE